MSGNIRPMSGHISRHNRAGPRALAFTVFLVTTLVAVAALSAEPVAVEAEKLGVEQPGADSLFSEDGYRMRQYRAPTPMSVSFATTVSSGTLQLMKASYPNPVFVDVVKIPWRQGRFIESEPHQNIPGSLWLPAAGLGDLPQPWVDHFKEVLDQATGGDLRRGIVFYCKSDCWLSWNAARRASQFGYKRIYWYREGVDGWRSLGLEFAEADPIAPSQNIVEIQ